MNSHNVMLCPTTQSGCKWPRLHNWQYNCSQLVTHWLWLWGWGGATRSWPGDTAEGFVCAPTVLIAKSLLPEQSAWRFHTQPTAAEVDQRQHADEYGQMVLNSGTFCSWTRPRQSGNSSQKSRKSNFTLLTVFHKMHIHKCWSLEAQVEFLHKPPSTTNEQPNRVGSKVCAERATHVQSKGSDTANNKVHRYLTLHGRLDLCPLTFSSAISGTT